MIIKSSATNRLTKVTCLIYLCFLAYGSLSPFSAWEYPASFFERLVQGTKIIVTYDLVQNILLYMPLGFLLHAGWKLSIKKIVLMTIVVSAMLELLQGFNPVRTPSLSDFLLNVTGAGIAGLFASAILKRHEWATLVTRDPKLLTFCYCGLLSYLAIQWWPYDPTLSTTHLKHQWFLFKSILVADHLHPIMYEIVTKMLTQQILSLVSLDVAGASFIFLLFNQHHISWLGLFYIVSWSGKVLSRSYSLAPQELMITLGVYMLICSGLILYQIFKKTS